MDLPVERQQLDPGLHAHTDQRPLVRAQQLADELGASMCTTPDEAEALLAELSSLPPLGAKALEVLGGLAHRLLAAARIVERTVDRAAEAVGERLAASGTGVAIHPTAVRERAASVIAEREAAAAAEDRLRVAEAEADAEKAQVDAAAASPAPVVSRPSAVASFVDEPPAPRRRWFQRRRHRDRYEEDTSESTSLLQQMAAATDEAFGARRATAARDDHLLLLRAQRDRAMEEVRVIERSWRDLAGDNPVEDVDAVIRRLDPQHQDALVVARETVGVRAVSTLLQRATQQWEEGWRSLGFDAPAVEPVAMDGVVERIGRAVVLVGDAIEQAEAITLAAPAAPVVTVGLVS